MDEWIQSKPNWIPLCLFVVLLCLSFVAPIVLIVTIPGRQDPSFCVPSKGCLLENYISFKRFGGAWGVCVYKKVAREAH